MWETNEFKIVSYGESTEKVSTKDEGVFVKEMKRYIVSDELEVKPLRTAASFSLLSDSGVMDGSTVDE